MAEILVLRLEPGASRTARALSRIGHHAVLSPVFAVAALHGGRAPSPPVGGAFAGVVAASANALAVLAPQSREKLAGLPALVVGARTRDAAAGAGLRPRLPACRTARELVARLGDTFAHGHLLYLAGRERRPDIGAALAARRDGFTLAEVYATTIAPSLSSGAQEALRRGLLAAVLHYSERSARAYVALARQAALTRQALAPTQLCLSATIASVLTREGARSVEVATSPDESHLLMLLPRLPA